MEQCVEMSRAPGTMQEARDLEAQIERVQAGDENSDCSGMMEEQEDSGEDEDVAEPTF